MVRSLLLIILLFTTLFTSCFANIRFVNRPDVQFFIQHMVKKYHFNEEKLYQIFSTINPRPQVLQFIRKPNEKKPWYAYQKLFITEWRIRKGVEFWNRYQNALLRAEKIYGVPASIIVATIGIETKYGNNTGDFRVLDALSNIAFSESPRSAYFKNELIEFLLLTREKGLDPLKVLGSYAGAIGQPQFMPSSYRHYAINFSGHPPIDLSNNEVDVIGSIANYYQKHGWTPNQSVAVSAKIWGKRYLSLLANEKMTISQKDLSYYGITPNYALQNPTRLKLIGLDGFWGNEYWLTMPNFDVIKRYNNSNLYAMAVFQLSQYITELRDKNSHA